MLKRVLTALVATFPLLLLAAPALAQTDPQATLFVGYSHLRTDVGSNDDGAHGIEVDYTYFGNRQFGFRLSAAGNWGSVPAPPNAFVVSEFKLEQYTFLAGPTAVLLRTMTTEVDASVLGGAAKRTLEAGDFGPRVSEQWGPVIAATVNLDFRLADQVWLRAVQPAVLFTRLDDEWQTDFRVGVGLVLRAGEILQ